MTDAPQTPHPLDTPGGLAGHVWFDGGQLVTDPEVVSHFRLRRAKWSPSSCNSLDNCPAGWAVSRLCREAPRWSDANAVGTAMHWVLENFYGQPLDLRTPEWIDEFVDHLEDRPEALDVIPPREQWPQWKATIRELSQRVFAMEDPRAQHVVGRERTLDQARIGGVPFNGKIDRTLLRRDPQTGAVTGTVVDDWKGLALDTPVPTPDGWATMGELRVGDMVLGSGPNPVSVLAKSGMHHRPCHRLVFDDGTVVVCDNVHLWQVTVGDQFHEAMTADDLLSEFRRAEATGVRVTVPGGHAITSMEPTDSVPTQCIVVDAPDSLFRCGSGMVLTHNSSAKGKKPEWKIRKYGDDHADQGLMYALALADMDGHLPDQVRILYVATGEPHDIAITPEELSRVEGKFVGTYHRMLASADAGRWDTNAGPLCLWCPAQTVCPTALAKLPTLRDSTPGIGQPDLAALRGVTETPGFAPAAGTGPSDAPHEQGTTPEDPEMPQLFSEAERWQPVAANGMPNASSDATRDAFALVGMANRAFVAADQPLHGVRTPALVQTFARIVADVQADLGASTSPADGLHGLLVESLRDAVERRPVPFGSDAAGWADWQAKVTRQVHASAMQASDLLHHIGSGQLAAQPWVPLASEPDIPPAAASAA